MIDLARSTSTCWKLNEAIGDLSKGLDYKQPHPRRAFLIAATSIFVIVIIA